jgi:cytidylate kinase
MTYGVVCVSGPDGAQMREVAQGVAERLGFALVDEEIILRAAAEGGVEPTVVADAEKRRSFMDRTLKALASSSDATAYVFSAGAGGLAEPEEPISSELRPLIRAAIEETAGRGSAVIVAHAASHALASQPDALRVLVTASPSIRRERVASERDLNEKDAARAIDESDAGRADYLKRFYGAKSELPTQYDLVVNTDRLSPDEAVSLVAHAAGR